MIIKTPHKQVIHFNNGTKKTINKVVKAEQGNWFHLVDEFGREIITNPQNILYVIVSEIKKDK